MRDYNKIINFKFGSEPVLNRERKGLSNRWFFYKPDIGNLSPSASMPFTSFESIPYYGGYPTGYSSFEQCAWSTPKRLKNANLIGFTHFSHNGSGDTRNFYNYFLIKPEVEDSTIESEEYKLGSYSIKTKSYSMSVNSSERVFKYSFDMYDALTIIPGYAGLKTKKYGSKEYEAIIETFKDHLRIKVDYDTVEIYWVLKLSKGAFAEVKENRIIINTMMKEFYLGYSLESFDDALDSISKYSAGMATYHWCNLLDKFDIVAGEEVEKTFYTCLYHALRNPFIYKDEVFSLCTMWDMYKTEFPLLLAFYKEESIQILKSLKKRVDESGMFYNAYLFDYTDSFGLDSQALSLINIIYSTAKLYGYDLDKDVKELQEKDIEAILSMRPPFKKHITHNLDLIDSVLAFNSAYGTEHKKTHKLLKLLKKLYQKKGTVLDETFKYYEGSNVNYSFRVSSETEERLKFTSEKKLERTLDRFFGFTSGKVKKFNKPTGPKRVVGYGNRTQRFEGLNNEPDMESPYMYGYIKKYAKQNSVLKDILNNNYSPLNNGLSGNDDSGALTSFYVWNALGLFPVVGTSKIRIGFPLVKKATINLNKPFTINVTRLSNDSVDYDSIVLNHKKLEEPVIDIKDILSGGELSINLK